MARKATHIEREQRIDEVYELLLHRVGHGAIVHHARQKWGLSERQAKTCIARARARIRAVAQGFDYEEALGKAICAYDLLFAKQMAAGDLRGARATLDAQVDLLGLAAPGRLEVLSLDALDREVARLEAQLARSAQEGS